MTKRTYRQRADSAGSRGSKERAKRGGRRGGVEVAVMRDKPRWNSDDAKFGKRRRLLCVCMSGDLLNRPRFQFHASEFDRGGERGR